ncbi:MAG: ModD protein [Deltaproteobacteria bacterium]|jgi:molybdenum transport protein|nr:ModD protein [Deltaproteobacteria bacterium]
MFLFPDSFIEGLMEEDLHIYDLTSQILGIEKAYGQVTAAAKDSSVAAGVEVARKLFVLAGAEVEVLAVDGQKLNPQDHILKATGLAGQLHAVYKVAQNVLEYAGGIAQRCSLLVELARKESPRAEILVTRKHFPGTKRLSLAAALAGGAQIHRVGLTDSILIFDQHSEFLGGSEALAKLIPQMLKKSPERKIAAEVANPAEAELLTRSGAEIIQCEKFSPEVLGETVKKLRDINPKIRIVAAGGVTSETVSQLAATGVDGLVTSWPYFGKPVDVKMIFKNLA